MKQLTLDQVIEAFSDKPSSVEDRLKHLGVDEEVIASFSEDLRTTQVYGTSFLKFLEDNKDKFTEEAKIHTKSVGEDFVNPFDDGEMTLLERLVAIGMTKEEAHQMFSADTLDLKFNSREFNAFVDSNKDKFATGIGRIAES